MPIIGIDYTKCTDCGLCVKECPRRYFEEQGKITFHDPSGSCISCGHCIAVCPQDAILYENMGDEPHVFDGIEDLSNYIPYEKMYNFLRATRSIRHYKSKKVPDNILRKVCRAMECAPTAANLRVEKFVILSDREQLKSLSDAVMEELLKNPSTRSQFSESFKKKKEIYEYPIYHDAPHVIIVYSRGKTTFEHFNIGNIITYGRLAAQSIGLGTCYNSWTQIAFELNPKLTKLAGVKGRSWGVITLGYPDINYVRCPPRSHKKVQGL
ncbi:MAG: nitroreductase family protein [Candidatus Hodarchaeota archaeon]